MRDVVVNGTAGEDDEEDAPDTKEQYVSSLLSRLLSVIGMRALVMKRTK